MNESDKINPPSLQNPLAEMLEAIRTMMEIQKELALAMRHLVDQQKSQQEALLALIAAQPRQPG